MKDAPRAKVLTARAIMAQGAPNGNGHGPSIRADSSLEEVLPLVAAHDGPVAVLDSAGLALGYVDRRTVITALMQAE